MIFRPLRLLALLLLLIVIGVPLAAVILLILAVTGSPGSCVPEGRTIDISFEKAVAFQTKWDQLDAALDAGQVSTVVFDDSETTSRAREWIAEHDVPADDVYICFEAGRGSGSGKIDVPFFPGDVDVLVRGTLDLTGEHPKIKIDDIEAGGLPGPLTDLMEGFVIDLVDDESEDLTLQHDYGIAFDDGTATLTGQP
jgi:hypothetical protein